MIVTVLLVMLPLALFFNRKRLTLFRWVKKGHAVVLTNMFGKQRVVYGSSRYSLFFEQETEISWNRSVGAFNGTQIPVSEVLHSVGAHLYRSRVSDVLAAISIEDPWKAIELELGVLEKPTSSVVSKLGERYGLTVELAHAVK